MTDPEYLETLLAPLRASFHARRRDRVGIANQIIQSAEAYVRAVDVSVTRELCRAHGLPTPAAGDPPERLASELLRLVQSLPELAGRDETNMPASTEGTGGALPREHGPVSSDAARRNIEARAARKPRRTLANVESVGMDTTKWPNLLAMLARSPLVILGGSPHFERLKPLPANVLERVEWIDTTRQGTHAIGNLERRIRDGRIGALIVLEGLVQHRHTDPLISAARTASLPHAFADKGGRGAMLEALTEIERKLSREHA